MISSRNEWSPLKKIVVGSAEGVSIQVAAKITDTQIQKDVVLFELIKDKIKNDSR